MLHEDLRCGPEDRDRFQMLAAVVNLTDTTLSTSIDWVPPVVPQATGPPGEPMGVKCRFWVRNVREESAEQTLEQIAGGKTALCILPWVPLMVGGDRPDVVERWKELALRQDKGYLLADYVALALVFAELVGREALWSAALKGFAVKDSRIAQQWEDKGVEKGRMLGQIHLYQEMLKQPLTPEKDLRALPDQELARLLDQLRKQLLSNGA